MFQKLKSLPVWVWFIVGLVVLGAVGAVFNLLLNSDDIDNEVIYYDNDYISVLPSAVVPTSTPTPVVIIEATSAPSANITDDIIGDDYLGEAFTGDLREFMQYNYDNPEIVEPTMPQERVLYNDDGEVVGRVTYIERVPVSSDDVREGYLRRTSFVDDNVSGTWKGNNTYEADIDYILILGGGRYSFTRGEYTESGLFRVEHESHSSGTYKRSFLCFTNVDGDEWKFAFTLSEIDGVLRIAPTYLSGSILSNVGESVLSLPPFYLSFN